MLATEKERPYANARRLVNGLTIRSCRSIPPIPQPNVKAQHHDLSSLSEMTKTKIAGFESRGTQLALTATIKRGLLFLALIMAALPIAGSIETSASTIATQKAIDLDHGLMDAFATLRAKFAKLPCKRPKVSAHHPCAVCAGHVVARAFNRTRPSFPFPKLKKFSVDLLTDRLAQAADEAAARLKWASNSTQLQDFASSTVIARTERLRI